MVSKHGSWFSHGSTPRAQIFRAEHTTVKDKDSMFKLMRYSKSDLQNLNKYLSDQFYVCICSA